MIILLHGPDNYRSRHKLRALIERFKEQRDPEGTEVVHLEGESLTIDELNSKLAAGSLFAQKRFVHVHGVFTNPNQDIFKKLTAYLEALAENGNENVVVFYEAVELEPKGYGAKKLPAAKKKLLAFLKQQPYSEYFGQLSVSQQNQWVVTQLHAKNIAIDADALRLLVARSENDLMALAHGLRKLIHFARGTNEQRITRTMVDDLTHDTFHDTIFALTDALSNNRPHEFFRQLEEHITAGATVPQLLALLQRQIKTLLSVKELLMQKMPPKDIAAQLKLHPFVVKKAIPQSRNFTMQQLVTYARELMEIEYRLKTGTGRPLAELNVLFIKHAS